MGRLRSPDLPPGPLKDLYDAIRELHAKAGWPGMRTLAKDMPISHAAVHALMTCEKRRVPERPDILRLAWKMAKIARMAEVDPEAEIAVDPEAEVAKIMARWDRAYRCEEGLPPPEDRPPPTLQRVIYALSQTATGRRRWTPRRPERTHLRSVPATVLRGTSEPIVVKAGPAALSSAGMSFGTPADGDATWFDVTVTGHATTAAMAAA